MCAFCGFTECPDGCPNHEETVDICPVCGKECERLIENTWTKEVVGCDRCTRDVAPEEAIWR